MLPVIIVAGANCFGRLLTIANRDLIYVSKAVLPFIIIQIVVLLLMTYLPGLVLWLPALVGYLE